MDEIRYEDLLMDWLYGDHSLVRKFFGIRNKPAEAKADDLKVFSNDVDTYVAKDLDDLQAAYKEFNGCTMAENDEIMGEWGEADPDKELIIRFEERGDCKVVPEGAQITVGDDGIVIRVKATCRAWAIANGRGFLCSTEW